MSYLVGKIPNFLSYCCYERDLFIFSIDNLNDLFDMVASLATDHEPKRDSIEWACSRVYNDNVKYYGAYLSDVLGNKGEYWGTSVDVYSIDELIEKLKKSMDEDSVRGVRDWGVKESVMKYLVELKGLTGELADDDAENMVDIQGKKYYISPDNCYISDNQDDIENYRRKTEVLYPTCGVIINGEIWEVFYCKTEQQYFNAIGHFCAYKKRPLDNIVETQNKYDRLKTCIYAMKMEGDILKVIDYDDILGLLYDELDHPKSSLRRIVSEITKIECLQRGVKTWIRG